MVEVGREGWEGEEEGGGWEGWGVAAKVAVEGWQVGRVNVGSEEVWREGKRVEGDMVGAWWAEGEEEEEEVE